jgi:hypothetical protein
MPTETALREVLEETGLTVTADRLTGMYYDTYEAGREALHFVFLCRTVGDIVVPHPSCDEITACSYWSADALPRPISDFTVRRIDDAIAVPGPVLPMAITPRRWLPGIRPATEGARGRSCYPIRVTRARRVKTLQPLLGARQRFVSSSRTRGFVEIWR